MLVTHVLTTRLVLDSSAYGWLLVQTECRLLSRVVVESCADGWAGRGTLECVE